MASAQRIFKTREEFKKNKELEEARKAGRVAPEVDEEGNDINPHIPQYISRAPWYMNQNAPSLKHQKSQQGAGESSLGLNSWYNRARNQAAASEQGSVIPTKFEKGSCTNCGAKTHGAQDCLERPRAKNAKVLNTKLRPDDVMQDVKLGFEGKRDRWNGYDPKRYESVIKEHERVDEERKKYREEVLDRQELGSKADSDAKKGGLSDPAEGEIHAFKQDDGRNVIIQEVDVDTKGTARNLRIREDTAKYLRNLALDSAFYDPKTRSMRMDPTPHINPDDKDYAGDNFVRSSGDTSYFAQLELQALKAVEQGKEAPHVVAEPSLAELVFREYNVKKETMEAAKREAISKKYGSMSPSEWTGSSDSKIRVFPQEQLVLEQAVSYREYTADGMVLNTSNNSAGRNLAGPPGSSSRSIYMPLAESKYQEDVYETNHSSVWGSFYSDGRWGYACCHQLHRNAYCTGLAGKNAVLKSKVHERKGNDDADASMEAKTRPTSNIAHVQRKHGIETHYNALSPDELEEYHRKRQRFDDPMRNKPQQEEEQDDEKKKMGDQH
mmetsp:Transcript_1297/g.2135  ORF Transcript_1297/g.2135 Transcript_1297/m.2135 type:complete len:552 (+) Transcript_1297:89-1744(+)